MKIIQIVLLVVLATTLFVAQNNWKYAATYPERREIVLKQGVVRWLPDAPLHLIYGYEFVGCSVTAPTTGVIAYSNFVGTGSPLLMMISGDGPSATTEPPGNIRFEWGRKFDESVK